MAIKLYGRPTSARTQKVMLALAELGLEYNYILASATMGPTGSVAKGGRPFGVVNTRKYLEMNPTSTIPTLDDNGYILWGRCLSLQLSIALDDVGEQPINSSDA